MTETVKVVFVHEGAFKGLWTTLPLDKGRLPHAARTAIEQAAGRFAGRWHTRQTNGAWASSPADPAVAHVDLNHPRHSPSQEHWNQLLMLVLAGRAEALG